MNIEIAVLSFFLLMIVIGLALIFTQEDNINDKPGYRLKICTKYSNRISLKYSKNYGFTWISIPLGITGKYEPRFYYTVKLENEETVKYVTSLFELYLNDYAALQYYVTTSKKELKELVADYRSKKLITLTKTSIT